MGLLKRITAALGRATSRIKKVFQRKPAPMPQPQTKGQARQKAMESAEERATKQAMWAIEHAAKNPNDRTAQQGRRKAIEYLSKAERLKGKGKLQHYNRQEIAERWLKNELSSAEGQSARKEKKLRVFNENFNINLSSDQAKVVTDLMESESYNKLIETYRGIYRELINAMGEGVANNVDPISIEKALSIFQEHDLFPDFDTFSKVLYLTNDEMEQLAEELYEYNSETVFDHIDEYQQRMDKEAILGQYIDWEEQE